jgi:hypothetical protein
MKQNHDGQPSRALGDAKLAADGRRSGSGRVGEQKLFIRERDGLNAVQLDARGQGAHGGILRTGRHLRDDDTRNEAQELFHRSGRRQKSRTTRRAYCCGASRL